jgi:hypothetical protein
MWERILNEKRESREGNKDLSIFLLLTCCDFIEHCHVAIRHLPVHLLTESLFHAQIYSFFNR